MATQTTGGGSTTSFTNTPQAQDDSYYFTEDQLLSIWGSSQIITLDVMSNDLGGNAKSLFSIDDGNGNPLDPEYQLLDKDAASVWETTDAGNQIRIVGGKVEYKFNNDINGLDDGECFEDTFVYAIRLGNGTLSQAFVRIKVFGQDDQPTLAPVTSGSVAEIDQSSSTTDGGLSGTLVGADPDGEPLAYGISGGTDNGDGTVSKVGTYGTLTVTKATGAYEYVKNGSAIEALDDGETPSDVFTVTVNDGDGPDVTQTYTVNITGADDTPTLAAVTSGSISEDPLSSTTTSLGLSGTLVGSDVDGESLTYGIQGGTSSGLNEVSLAGAFGTLTVNTLTGEYSYAPDADAIEGLDDGETPSDVFTVTVSDGDAPLGTQTYTVNLAGANDAPVSGGNDSASGTEDDASIGGTVPAATDVDVEPLTYQLVAGSVEIDGVAAPDGTVTLNADGTYSYDPSGDQDLDDGEERIITFRYVANDGDADSAEAEVTITVNGVNDAPVTGGDDAASGSEDDASIGGTVPVATDVEGDSLTYALVSGSVEIDGVPAGDGTVTFNADGTYSYDPSGDQDLDDGEERTITFRYVANDGDADSAEAEVTITVNGADDQPTLAAVTSGSVAEVPDSTSTIDSGLSGTLVGNDVDVETLTYGIVGGVAGGPNEVTLAGTYGTLTVNTLTGAYTYTKNAAAIEALNAGQTPSDVFTVTVSDGNGPTVNQTYTVNITGANDVTGVAPTDIRFALNEATAPAAGANINAGTILGSFTAIDSDSSTWTFTLTGTGASAFVLSPASGLQSSVNLNVGASNISANNYELIVTATDGNGNSFQETFFVRVGTTGADTTFVISSGTDIDFGQNGNDVINGGSGDDSLVGGQNEDTLNGGLGTDELLGSGGNDFFRFEYNGTTTNLLLYGVDRILDMNASNDDTIQLDDALFAGIGGPGALAAGVFVNGPAALDANDRIIYNQATGALYYDPDGNGVQAAVQFAQLDAGTILTTSDFQVI